MKSEHNGAKNGGGAWDSRANAKTRSKKLRREESREQAREYGEAPRGYGCVCCGADLTREGHAHDCEALVEFEPNHQCGACGGLGCRECAYTGWE